MAKKNITIDELIAEIERLRANVTSARNRRVLTDEQRQALLIARDGSPPVPWGELVDFWRNKFGWGCEDTLRKLYRAASNEDADASDRD